MNIAPPPLRPQHYCLSRAIDTIIITPELTTPKTYSFNHLRISFEHHATSLMAAIATDDAPSPRLISSRPHQTPPHVNNIAHTPPSFH